MRGPDGRGQTQRWVVPCRGCRPHGDARTRRSGGSHSPGDPAPARGPGMGTRLLPAAGSDSHLFCLGHRNANQDAPRPCCVSTQVEVTHTPASAPHPAGRSSCPRTPRAHSAPSRATCPPGGDAAVCRKDARPCCHVSFLTLASRTLKLRGSFCYGNGTPPARCRQPVGVETQKGHQEQRQSIPSTWTRAQEGPWVTAASMQQ